MYLFINFTEVHSSPVATVCMETPYEVAEDMGVIMVCAVVSEPQIDCPVDFPFNVNVTTVDGNAGIVCMFISILLYSR